MCDVYGSDMDYFRRVSPGVLAEAFLEAPVSARATVRVVIGDRDPMVPLHATFEARLQALGFPHVLADVPGVGHKALPLIRGMADANWAFYRTALGVPWPTTPPRQSAAGASYGAGARGARRRIPPAPRWRSPHRERSPGR
jgi:acetyl esterase/lipase